MLEAIEKIIDIIGYFGPQILILFTIFLLFNKYTLLQIYLIGFVINSFLNFVLKGIIKQPRPSEDKHVFNVWLNNGMKGDRLWFDRFGMPSGHAQSVFYSTFFISFALQNTNINILYLIISLNTLYQRVKYKNHTVLQVIVGAIVGTIIGSLLYYYSQKILQGKLKEKEDDNAPI
jgi:membrane-associated phospholipid phosphatase